MTIDQVIRNLNEEKMNNISSRFPCRAIMVQSLNEYIELISRLHNDLNINIVPSDTLFSGSDVMPRYENLTSPIYASSWMILPGVSEYLRLFWKNESDTQRFAKLWSHQSPASSTGRIIIPLWGCVPQWYDQSLHLTDDIRQKDFYYSCVCSDEIAHQMNIVVFADSFIKYEKKLSSGLYRNCSVYCGLKSWYDYWTNPSASHNYLALMTARFRYVQAVGGSITVKVIRDILDFIKENLFGGDILTPENCPSEAQEYLFDKALCGGTLDAAILSCLNIGNFSTLDVMGRWNLLSKGQKQLVCLWCQLHSDNSYLCHCILGSKDLNDIENRILHEIFLSNHYHSDWIAESQDLINSMKLQRDDDYYEELDKLSDYNERILYLTSETEKERVYLLRMVGLWMREDADEVLKNEKLKQLFPAMEAYLDGEVYDIDLRRYMGLYKTYKLSNTLPVDEKTYFSNIQIDTYDYRYAALSQALSDECIVLWVDAMGVEWMPLLLWALNNSTVGSVKMSMIGQADLPAETAFNLQWKKMNVPYKKLDKLDKLAHKGIVDDPNYYSCVEEQIAFIVNLSKKAEELFKDYNRVIITGDHGASRLAARFFHNREGIPIQKDWKALNHGRYALVPSFPSTKLDTQICAKDENGNNYLVISNYDHFVQSGFAAGSDDDVPIYGEVHGGATPEEALVPIIVFDSNKPIPIRASWKRNKVKIKNKMVKAILVFNQTVKKLEVKIGANNANTIPSQDGKEWTVLFSGIKEGQYKVNVVADNSFTAIEDLQVLSALGNQHGGIF